MVPAPRSEKIIPSEENWRPFRYCLTVTHCIQNSFEAKKHLWWGFFNVLSTLFLRRYTSRVSQYEWIMSKWYDWWLPDRTLKIGSRRLGAASKLKPRHLNWACSPLNMNDENKRYNHDMKDDVMWCNVKWCDVMWFLCRWQKPELGPLDAATTTTWTQLAQCWFTVRKTRCSYKVNVRCGKKKRKKKMPGQVDKTKGKP